MPKSKRNQQISLTKTRKKDSKSSKANLYQEIQQKSSEFKFLILFKVENNRNNFMKQVRMELKDSKMYFGSNRVMAKALGLTSSEEVVKNASLISTLLTNNVGLIFTNSDYSTLVDYFSNLKFKDFARQGAIAKYDFVVKQGILKRGEVNFPSNMEPLLRKLGLPTELQKGAINCRSDYVVCKQGQELNQDACLLLVRLF